VDREIWVGEDMASAAGLAFVEAAPTSVALAGGSTPRALYEALAGDHADHPWEELEVFFSDERCVRPDHPDSNYLMAEEALLSRLPPPGPRVHRMPGDSCDAAGYERELRAVLGDRPVLDLVILGLGEDGHTASLFPGDPALEEAERLVARVDRPDHARLTLTLPVLSAARMAMFLVAGEAKRSALRRLLADEDIPAARVAAERVLVFADTAAAR
jgi:6-phosphogluconolactonase